MSATEARKRSIFDDSGSDSDENESFDNVENNKLEVTKEFIVNKSKQENDRRSKSEIRNKSKSQKTIETKGKKSFKDKPRGNISKTKEDKRGLSEEQTVESKKSFSKSANEKVTKLKSKETETKTLKSKSVTIDNNKTIKVKETLSKCNDKVKETLSKCNDKVKTVSNCSSNKIEAKTKSKKLKVIDDKTSQIKLTSTKPQTSKLDEVTIDNSEPMREVTIDNSEPMKEVKEESTSLQSQNVVLTAAQRGRMEHNRQKALLIKQDKMNKTMPNIIEKDKKKKVIKINNKVLVDTEGGFFIEENPGLDKQVAQPAPIIVSEPALLFEEDRPFCDECQHPFNHSYLLKNFDEHVCDQCRDKDEKHRLITKTDARNEYLLKDVDLDLRKPPLKYIIRKNPHNSHWGDMKLYLKLQVEKRALELWKTEEALEEAMNKKEDQQDMNKKKRFANKMKQLRMNVRSSLYTKASKTHDHEYDDEVYLPDEDEYARTCKTCGHTYTYDKL